MVVLMATYTPYFGANRGPLYVCTICGITSTVLSDVWNGGGMFKAARTGPSIEFDLFAVS